MKSKQGESVIECAERIMGKAASANLAKCLRELDVLYRKEVSRLPLFQLGHMIRLQGVNTYHNVQLFHENDPPKSAYEFLGAVKLATMKAEAKHHSEMKVFFDLVLLDPVQQSQYHTWEAARWEKALEALLNIQDNRPKSPVFRLKLLPQAVLVEMASAQGELFRKASLARMRDICRELSWKKFIFDDDASEIIFRACIDDYGTVRKVDFAYDDKKFQQVIGKLLRDQELLSMYVVDENGDPVKVQSEPLEWVLISGEESDSYSSLSLRTTDGKAIRKITSSIPGSKPHVLIAACIHPVRSWPLGPDVLEFPVKIPKRALLTTIGYKLLKTLAVPIPEDIAKSVQVLVPTIDVKCFIKVQKTGSSDYLQMQASGRFSNKNKSYSWRKDHWDDKRLQLPVTNGIIEIDRSPLEKSADWLGLLDFKLDLYSREAIHEFRVTKAFPELFLDWMNAKPEHVEVTLDQDLNDLFNGVVSGNVMLEIEPSSSGIDWFDIHVDVSVSDTTLTQEDIALLLKARGRWVRITGKGWRKLEYNLSEEMERELADIGLSAHDFTGEKQKLHALQLGALAKKNSKLLPQEASQQITRRIDEIQTRVVPKMPSAIEATLRPYQTEGFHFLAYLSTNQFGGVLADDMGLGKTLQALTWLAWLREKQKKQLPSLVIAPKSVQENWGAEVARFYPKLRTLTWKTGEIEDNIDPKKFDLLIINYAQLRNRSEHLKALAWNAVIVDEAQNIKNPTSQSAQVACALNSNHRLALTGTPIENRLMDLWSIFAFAMPGVLGSRAAFAKTFDNAKDPFARRRLSARTRPFLLRRTKNEVAKDLPERIEEDLSIELEGVQQKLYLAELKRAKAHLLKAQIPGQLDKLRFHLLTSLLRLRQICCHTDLVGLEKDEEKSEAKTKKVAKKSSKKSANVESLSTGTSAKLDALMELLEPLIEEGQKVLVFSQFVTMLDIIHSEVKQRGWGNYLLTGQTNERGTLVKEFQSAEGAAVFLISLKAGGAGLNLTAASYVVLFDPWWNPAVEAQAIDRTHRIGQKSTVIAYRLVVKDTIEQKIRELQKHKSAIAQDILGEENFARALTLNDFQFLLGE